MIYLASICVALVALLAYREWGAARERREAAQERAALLQRIQAPQVAVTDHARAQRPRRPSPRPIAADDDKRFLERGHEVEHG